VEDLRERGFLAGEEPHRHALAISERTRDVIEPLLSLQWFVRMAPLAEPALQAYREGRLTFVPERYGRTYEQWLQNIRDWNVSRQLWWGHRLPVWYAPDGTPVVAETEEEARAIALLEHGTSELTQDPDTLDTWFSSGLWPLSILGWPERTAELACWYPSQVMITGWEIIFLWVARMVILGLHLVGELPFARVFITPLVFDSEGRKMSKSLGNAIDPLDLVEKYGADAFRMGILRQMRLEGQEIRFQESRCEEARNFNNKVWNATRYMLSLPEALPPAMTLPRRSALTPADCWILVRLRIAIETVSASFDTFDIGGAAEAIWRFIWHEFCDWYVEAAKVEHNARTRTAVLSYVWNAAMRLLHPISPFISEEVWLALPHDGESIMTATWPDVGEIPYDDAVAGAAAEFEATQREAERIRTVRAEAGLHPKERIDIDVPENVSDVLASTLAHFTAGAVHRVPAVGSSAIEAIRAIAARAPRDILSARYRKDAQRLRAEVERLERKLANADFVAKAAPTVVAKEREKLDGYRNDAARVEAALASLGESH
jgi:valyl-tRNA synthetase